MSLLPVGLRSIEKQIPPVSLRFRVGMTRAWELSRCWLGPSDSEKRYNPSHEKDS